MDTKSFRKACTILVVGLIVVAIVAYFGYGALVAFGPRM